MDFAGIMAAAEGYKADMTKLLRDMVKIPGESGSEKAKIDRAEAEMRKLGFDKVEIDTVGIGDWEFDPNEGYENDEEISGRGTSDQEGVVASVQAEICDADIAIFSPDKQLTLTHDMLHENTDYTPYEGFRLTGWLIATVARGKIVCQNGEFLGEKGRGRYLRRGLPVLVP